MNVDFSPDQIQNYVKTGFDKRGLVVLPGILSMAYFIHSAVTTLGNFFLEKKVQIWASNEGFASRVNTFLVKDNQNQENNKRDLGIAYILVFLTYTVLGLIFYLTYPGYKGCITDMFIDVSISSRFFWQIYLWQILILTNFDFVKLWLCQFFK